MKTEREPMEVLRGRMRKFRRNSETTDARIRAAMIEAMMDGADKDEIEAMARAVGLHSEETTD